MHYWSDGAASQFNNQYNDLELQELKMLLPWDIRTVHYWSDGAASQFNNQHNFMNIAYHERDKHVARRAILQGKETVTSPGTLNE